jgi:hypothetical protein
MEKKKKKKKKKKKQHEKQKNDVGVMLPSFATHRIEARRGEVQQDSRILKQETPVDFKPYSCSYDKNSS